MKRSLILTVALSLAAALTYSAVGSAQSTLTVINRAQPLQVTSTVKPKRDRFRPYVFTTTGRIIPPSRYCAPGQKSTRASPCLPILCPAGVTDIRYCLLPGRTVICTGVVTVRVQKRGTTISARNVRVRPNCTYRSTVTFSTLLRTRVGVLSFRSRFQGNVVLEPRNASTKSARAR